MDAEILDHTGDSQQYRPIKTTAYLTKYEKARVLGTRAMQIAQGAPVHTDVGTEKDPLNIAEMELEKNETPLIIRRHLPDGTFEDVAVRNLLRVDKKVS